MTRIIVDCTHTFQTGARTGIQRMVREFVDSLLEIAREDGPPVIPARIEAGRLFALPIEEGRVAFQSTKSARGAEAMDRRYLALHPWGARINRLLRSRRFEAWLDAGPNENGLARLLARKAGNSRNGAVIDLMPDDILLSLDSSWVYDIRTVLDAARRTGATRISVLCDVLPLSHPEFFAPGTRNYFRGWLKALLPRLDGVIAISEATRAELEGLAAKGYGPMPRSRVVHLGAEIEGGSDGSVRAPLRALISPHLPPAFLTVGTLEPRKNVDYALDLFDELARRHLEFQWHIAGAPGWLTEKTAERIRGHCHHGASLFWWTDLTDAELAWCYRHAAALVAVSRAEGFGLPLVEARLHGLAVFASDIAVFREVLGDEGRYLPLDSARIASAVLEDFLTSRTAAGRDDAPTRVSRPWREAAKELRDSLLTMDRERRSRP